MAKSSRASSRKVNNRRKATSVFGPAEIARNERLSQKLLELARQPKPESSDANMDTTEGSTGKQEAKGKANDDDTAMEVDQADGAKAHKGKKRVDSRRQKKSGILFKQYSDRVGSKKKKGSR